MFKERHINIEKWVLIFHQETKDELSWVVAMFNEFINKCIINITFD